MGNTYSSDRGTPNGGPQGSVITMISWLIYIDDLFDTSDADSKGLFMDDVSLVLTEQDVTTLLTRIREELEIVGKWSIRNGIKFNAEKFHLLDMGAQSISVNLRDSVDFMGDPTKWSVTARYLGVIVDHNLDWKPHLKNLICRMESKYIWFSEFADRHTGGSPRVLEIMFFTYMWSIVVYSIPVWVFHIIDASTWSSTWGRGAQIRRGYTQYFTSLNSCYLRCGRAILVFSGQRMVDRFWLSLGGYLSNID